MIDCLDGDLDDHELYAHLAGQSVAATDSGDDPYQGVGSTDDIHPDSTDNLGVSALVAESLGNLLLN